MKKLFYHLPFILFSYFFIGIIIGGFFASQDRVDLLNCSLVSNGWIISAITFVIYLPILFLYVIKTKN
jgi:hypothetical protein